MASNSTEIAHNFFFFKAYKDGRVEFNRPPCSKIPPSDDPLTGVQSKDVQISSEPSISARIFLPKFTNSGQKLPVLFYIHGGGFCIESAFSQQYHNFCNAVAAESGAIVVSVEYGLFPARPIPACYEDSWTALKWIASHTNAGGPEAWLNDHADFGKVFIGGDSAGGNISHTLAYRVGTIGLQGVKLVGVIMAHPYFGGTGDDSMWLYMCQSSNGGLEDPRLKPSVEDMGKLGCERMLIFVAEKDHLIGVGKRYYEEVKRSEWKGNIEIVENKGEGHVFHLMDPSNVKSLQVLNKFAHFIKQP